MANFARRQQARVQKAQQDLAAVGNDLAALVDLSAWFGVYVDGAAAVAARALASLAPPLDERFKCCTVLAWSLYSNPHMNGVITKICVTFPKSKLPLIKVNSLSSANNSVHNFLFSS